MTTYQLEGVSMSNMDAWEEIATKAKVWGKERHSDAVTQRHAAFANSVAYLVTGASGGYGGPSIREHCVSWALAGDGENIPVETNLGTLTMQIPDGRLPRAGEWEFDRACAFADPICYGPLPAMAARIAEQEHCFDDDPADLEALRLGK
jgi:hypothetical protein